MRIFLPTCDKYDHLLPGFAYLLNRYWPGQQVVVFCFRQPPALPPNFTIVNYGPETRSWTDHLRFFIEHEPDRYFTFLLDDYWLISPVDETKVRMLVALVDSGQIAKGDLSTNTRHFGAKPFGDYEGMIVSNQDSQYRSSTQPAIWSRSYMLKLLKEGKSPWQFEIEGMALTRHDGCNIVAFDGDRAVYNYANIYLKGKVESWQVDRIPAEDRSRMRELGIYIP